MKKRIVGSLTVLSGVCFIIVSFFLVRTLFWVASDRFNYIWLADGDTYPSQYRQMYICTSSLGIRFSYAWDLIEMGYSKEEWEHQVISLEDWKKNEEMVHEFYPDAELSSWDKLKWDYEFEEGLADVTLPYWLMLMVFIFLPLLRYRKWRKKMRQRQEFQQAEGLSSIRLQINTRIEERMRLRPKHKPKKEIDPTLN